VSHIQCPDADEKSEWLPSDPIFRLLDSLRCHLKRERDRERTKEGRFIRQ
jgi:hypothetical protein